MCRLVFLVPLLLLCHFCISQDIFHISLAKQKLKINLQSIWIDEVIDARHNKETIGFVQRGMSNNKTKVDFEKGIEKEISDFINSHLRLVDKPIPVALKIDSFNISENTNSGKVDILIQVLIKQESGYLFVKELETSHVIKGIDVTSRQDKNIASAIRDLFKSLSNNDFTSAYANNILISKQNLTYKNILEQNNKFIQKNNFPILTEKLREGIYNTYEDFRDNNPIANPNIFLRKNKRGRITEVTPYYSESYRKLKDNHWGFCLNDTAYIQVDKKYYPLNIEENSIYFYGFKGDDPSFKPNFGPSIVMGVVWGAFGGLVAGSVLAEEINEPVKYKLDLFSGKVTNKDLRDMSTITNKKSTLVILRYPRGQINQSVTIIVDKTKSLSFNLDDYSKIEIGYPFSPVEICLYADKNRCISFTPEPNKIKFLAILFTNKDDNNPYQIIELPNDMGQSYLNRAIRKSKQNR